MMMLHSVGLAIVIAVSFVLAIHMTTGLDSLAVQYPGKLTEEARMEAQSKVNHLIEPFVTWFQRGVNGVVLSTWLGLILRAAPNRR